jgi:hypothetical protein
MTRIDRVQISRNLRTVRPILDTCGAPPWPPADPNATRPQAVARCGKDALYGSDWNSGSPRAVQNLCCKSWLCWKCAPGRAVIWSEVIISPDSRNIMLTKHSRLAAFLQWDAPAADFPDVGPIYLEDVYSGNVGKVLVARIPTDTASHGRVLETLNNRARHLARQGVGVHRVRFFTSGATYVVAPVEFRAPGGGRPGVLTIPWVELPDFLAAWWMCGVLASRAVSGRQGALGVGQWKEPHRHSQTMDGFGVRGNEVIARSFPQVQQRVAERGPLDDIFDLDDTWDIWNEEIEEVDSQTIETAVTVVAAALNDPAVQGMGGACEDDLVDLLRYSRTIPDDAMLTPEKLVRRALRHIGAQHHYGLWRLPDGERSAKREAQ